MGGGERVFPATEASFPTEYQEKRGLCYQGRACEVQKKYWTNLGFWETAHLPLP